MGLGYGDDIGRDMAIHYSQSKASDAINEVKELRREIQLLSDRVFHLESLVK